LLALWKAYLELSHYIPVEGGIREELANRLLEHYTDSPHADSFLVRGLKFCGSLEDGFQPEFPDGEVMPGPYTWCARRFEVTFPSALYLFTRIPDYHAGARIIALCPDAFVSPGLRGWRAAIQGFVNPPEAVERFMEAAQAFAEDIYVPERETTWSSANTQLWAKYFRGRAALARVPREPGRASDFLLEAANALEGTESGWANGSVARFRILVQTLSSLLGNVPGFDPARARERFAEQIQLLGEGPDDEVGQRFLQMVDESFAGFRANPVLELTTGRLRDALDALGRISLIGPRVSAAVTPAIAERAYQEVLGPERTQIHRILESISDESVFRKLLMRLLQAAPSPPAYGHIRHGPLEHGKDVVVQVEEGGRQILRMYQAKCGDITTRVWREARAELEEVFDVPLPELQLRAEPDEREGILVCNGHANPHVEPLMSGWFERQRLDHRRTYRFMHLDDLVGWIDGQRLYGTFRSACAELGLSATQANVAPAGRRRRAARPRTRRN
jgi:hypothetical protein